MILFVALKRNSFKVGSANSSWFDSYHPYADHIQFLNDLQARYDVNSEIVVAGNSDSGRPITGIHIYGSAGKDVKPAVVFHGTVHAREWISTMVITNDDQGRSFALNGMSNRSLNTSRTRY